MADAAADLSAFITGVELFWNTKIYDNPLGGIYLTLFSMMGALGLFLGLYQVYNSLDFFKLITVPFK